MGKKLFGFMENRFGILWCMVIILLVMLPAKALLSGQEQVGLSPAGGGQGVDKRNLGEACPEPAEWAERTQQKSVVTLLANKTASEKCQIKSAEISKRDFIGVYDNTQYGVKVEIVGNPTPIEANGQHGIELFARAWRGNQQLGFGEDGSVEIERFRIFNPPILVDDPNGDIVREWTDIKTGELKQRKLREDPLQAIKEVIAHNVTLVGKDNGKIVIGKVGNTTSTFYPDADPESTSVDGAVGRANVPVGTWEEIRNGAGAYVKDNEIVARIFDFDSSRTTDKWSKIIRGIQLFDTSAISDTDTIDSATLSFYGETKVDQGSYAADVNVYSSTPASNIALVEGDYGNTGSTAFSTAITFADWSTSGYNNFALNASGLANISKTGVSKFSTRNANYDVANVSPTWRSDAGTHVTAYYADQTGTSQDPKLVMVHSAPTSSETITRVVNSGGSILGASSLTMNFNITGSNLILFVSTFKQNSETITGVTWNGVPLTQVESAISYTTNNVQLWYLLAPAVGTHDLVTTASGSSGYIITYYTLYSGVKQTGQLDGSTRVTGNTPITATITTGTDNTWAFLTSVQGGSAGTNATLIAEGDMRTYDNQGYGTIAPGTAFSMTVNLQPGNTGGVIMATFKDAAPPATPTPTPTPSTSDTTAPTNTSITINSGASYTNSTTVTVTLSATDSVGVTGYYLSTSSSTPVATASGWNSVTSTTSYSGSASYPLTRGDENKTIYAWFKDAAGNVSSTASDSIILDTTAPIVTITSPTSGDTYTATGSTVSMSGNASDSLSGISSVTWSNDKGGRGDASGTTYWSVSNISLSSGDNKITVTAKDNVGNTATDTITVTYTAGTAPTVKTGSATNVTANSATLSGTVNANGLSTTAWFEYGTLSGLYGSKSSTQTVTSSNDTTVSITITGLTSGTTYYYKIVAENNSGKSEGSEMSFQYTQSGNAPTVETEAATDITNTTAKLNGKCNPNGQSTTAWFEYGTLSGTYNYQTSTQSVSGSSYTNVSATITGLTVGTKYYYRIAAKNSAGTSYGKEMEFYKSPGTDTTPTPTATPKPTPTSTASPVPTLPPLPTQPPLPTPQPSPTPAQEGIVFGFVNDEDDLALEGVTVKIERVLLAAVQGENVPVQAASQNQQEDGGNDRGRKGFRLSPLRTVQAGLPHTALQSVVTPSGLTD